MKANLPRPLGAACPFLALALTLALVPVAARAQSRTDPGFPDRSNQHLEIGPVSGLTTVWHASPRSTALPLGARVQFRVRAAPSYRVSWTGAVEVARNRAESVAEKLFDSPGPHSVAVVVTDPHGNRIEESAELQVVELRPNTATSTGILVSDLRLFTDQVQVDLANPNASSRDYLSRSASIAALRKLSDDHYRTSINRVLRLEAHVEPEIFAPLVEWRLDGRPQEDLGTPILLEIFTAPPYSHRLSAGPVAEEAEIQLDTYLVRITGASHHQDLPEGSPLTFTAVTEPPGYEGEITWLAATRYGNATPWMGQGPEFTVVFEDTFGAEERNVGVRADHRSVVGLLQGGRRQGGSPLACSLAALPEPFDPGTLSLLGELCAKPPVTQEIGFPSDDCYGQYWDCMQDACFYADGLGGGFEGPPVRIHECSPNLDVWLGCGLALDYCLHRRQAPGDITED